MDNLTIGVIVLCGGAGGLVAMFVTGWALDKWASREPKLGGAHRAVETPLPPAPVEVIRLPDRHTEEIPAVVDEEPVEHVGATVDWSPTQELPPIRPLDPIEAQIVDEEEELRAELDRVLGPILDELARVGHVDCPTAEWSAADVAAMVEQYRVRAGATR